MLSGLDTQSIIADSDLEFLVSEKDYTLSKKINFACQDVHWNKNEVKEESCLKCPLHLLW